jgi:hypothetical protein
MNTKLLIPILTIVLSSCIEKEPNEVDVSKDILEVIKSIDENIEKAKSHRSPKIDSFISDINSYEDFKFHPDKDSETTLEDSFLIEVMMSSEDISKTPK